MESTKTETASVWTDEKHLHFLNTMEASFVNTMLHRYGVSTHPLPLDRYLPDTSESTLDSKPNRRPKKHAPADSMGRPRARRTKRRSSQLLQNSSAEQAVAQLENGRESAACVVREDDKDKEPRSNV
ncbi:transmembrane ascorbate ferrireductase [Spatholobus suberectus]|nr:transmembrane ascorbate ferrireductase [Spatholobus suberectus]